MSVCNWFKKHHRIAYLILIIKVLVFYWQTDRLDMLSVFPVGLLTLLFLFTIYEVCAGRDSRSFTVLFCLWYGAVTVVMFLDAAYSNYFGQYISINQIYQIGSLGQIAADGNVLGATLNPGIFLCLIDLPFMILCYRGRPKRQGRLSWVVHTLLYAAAILAFWYYGLNPVDSRAVQKVNHIEHFTYHANDILVNVIKRIQHGQVDEEALIKRIDELVPRSEGKQWQGIAKGKNLILIQVESLNDFVLGETYNGQEITPFLNSMMKTDTFYFNHFYSTTGVGNTADAEFSALNGLYGNTIRECYRRYVDNTYYGLPWMLRDEGYGAYAFHGYQKTFWNREEAYKNQGFQKFYSEDDFAITETAGFGLTDKEMFDQSVDILKDRNEPFFAFMITLTNHIPYELDDELSSLVLKPGDQNTTFGRYLKTVRYTDEAIAELVARLKECGLYEDTVIALYGDHQGLNMQTPAVQTSMTNFLGRTYDYDEMLHVPLIIHVPGSGEHKTVTAVGGEVDIMPTIANLMGITPGQPYVFGHDLLNAKEGFVAQLSYIGAGSFITGQGNMIFAIGKDGTVEGGRCIDLDSGTEKKLNKDQCELLSIRSNALISTCQEVLDHNLIKRPR